MRSLQDAQQPVPASDQPGTGIGQTMKRHIQQQTLGLLRQADAGLPVKELRRKHGVREPSCCAGKAKFGGGSVSDVRRPQPLDAECTKRKKLRGRSVLEIGSMRCTGSASRSPLRTMLWSAGD
jgi:putative transposase